MANGNAQRESDEENVNMQLKNSFNELLFTQSMCFVHRTILLVYRVRVIRTPHHIAEVEHQLTIPEPMESGAANHLKHQKHQNRYSNSGKFI